MKEGKESGRGSEGKGRNERGRRQRERKGKEMEERRGMEEFCAVAICP